MKWDTRSNWCVGSSERLFDGDLRNLGVRCGHDPDRAGEELQRFTGVGPTGADVFLREVQLVWPWVRPHFDARALVAARELPPARHAARARRAGPAGIRAASRGTGQGPPGR